MKKEIVITGTMVARSVQVLAIGFALWNIKSLDSDLIAILFGSLVAIEAGLQGNKKKKE